MFHVKHLKIRIHYPPKYFRPSFIVVLSLLQNTYHKNRQNVSRETFCLLFFIFNIFWKLFLQILYDVKSQNVDLPISKQKPLH